MEGGRSRAQAAGGQSLARASSHLRRLTCALLRGGSCIWGPRPRAVESPPAASNLNRRPQRAFRRPKPGRGRYGNAGPQQSQPAGPAPSCGDCEFGAACGEGCRASCDEEGRLRACGGRVLAGAPARWPKAGGRARET